MVTKLKDFKITLIVDEKGAVRGLKSADGQILKVGQSAGIADTKAKGMTSTFKGMGPILLAAGAALAVVTVALGKSIVMAGNAEETWSKFNAVFKENAADTAVWVDSFSSAVQRSRTDVADWAASLQDTFVPMGFARDQATELSKELVTLAVDLASFNNKADDEVIRDFQSAMVGNTETLRKYGVVITQVTLDQELLTMGIEGGVKVATEQEKVQARLAILTRSTTDAQGDAIKTAGSFNNQVKGLNAAFDDLTITLGQKFLPAATDTVGVLAGMARALERQISGVAGAESRIDSLHEKIRNLKQAIEETNSDALREMWQSQLPSLQRQLILASVRLEELKGTTKEITGEFAAEEAALRFMKATLGETSQEYITLANVLKIMKGELEIVEDERVKGLTAIENENIALEEQIDLMDEAADEAERVAEAEQKMSDAAEVLAAEEDAVAEALRRANEAFAEQEFKMNAAVNNFSTFVNAVAGLSSTLAAIQIADLDRTTQARIDALDQDTLTQQEFSDQVAQIRADAADDEADIRSKQKPIMIAQAIASTALGVAGALGTPPFGPFAIGIAAIIAATGLAQVALIDAQQFATGGSFRVGGTGGTDSQMVPIIVTPGERVTVQTPAQQRSGGLGSVVLNVTLNGPVDQDWFQNVASPELEELVRRGMSGLAVT